MEEEIKDDRCITEVEAEVPASLGQVYKSCERNWIVTLQPVEGTITNIGRDKVIDQRYAKFRGNKFMVVGIEHKYDPTLTTKSVTNSCYRKQSLIYEIGTIVAVEDFDVNPNNICSTGVHFFMTKECAFTYEAPTDEYREQLSGPYTTYHENGCKASETTYKNGVRHGPCNEYYTSGNKKSTSNYENGKLSGLFIAYLTCGNTGLTSNYENGKQVTDSIWNYAGDSNPIDRQTLAKVMPEKKTIRNIPDFEKAMIYVKLFKLYYPFRSGLSFSM
jgi:hypothetical protein